MVTDDRAFMNMQNDKINMVLKVHNYAFTEPSGVKGRWQTYVKENGYRKLLRASSYDSLIEKLYDFYYAQESAASITMDRLFHEWLAYKESITDSLKTVRRHEQHWEKYFSLLKSREAASFDRLELQKVCNLLVKDHRLSSKEWQNVKTILSGMFSYACEKHYISDNLMNGVRITVKFRQINKKSGRTETFQTDELEALFQYLDREISCTGDIVLSAVKFNFFAGCRVGELVALKWIDLADTGFLHICREEIKDSVRSAGGWKDVYRVVEHTKTHTDRIIPLIPAAASILDRIRFQRPSGASDDDFIFIRSGVRITARQVNYALEKACRYLGIPVKRSHKIRKTVASRLSAGNVPLDSIREILGHSNLNTTLGYIYNPLSDKETYLLMEKAL